MSAEPVSIAEPPPSSCGHPLPSPQSVTSRKFSDTLQTDYFYRPGLAGAYGCNLKVSWYLRRNRTPGTSDCTKRPDFDASCCFDRTCTHQRRLIWDGRSRSCHDVVVTTTECRFLGKCRKTRGSA